MQVKKQQLESDREDRFKIEKGVQQGCILSLYLFNFYAEYIMWNARLEESQVGIKIARRNTNNLRYADATILMVGSEEELKYLLLRVKEESEKVGLKLNTIKTKIMASSSITSWQVEGRKVETLADFIFLGSKITMEDDCSHEIKRHLLLGRKAMKPRQHIKKQRHYFANKGPYSQSCGFSSSHVWMWELEHQEGWALKNWCFQTVMLEKTLESPLDSKKIKPVNPKGNQPWIFIGRTEAEAPVLWPPDVKSLLTGKDSDAGKDWKQKEKEVAEDEMVR